MQTAPLLILRRTSGVISALPPRFPYRAGREAECSRRFSKSMLKIPAKSVFPLLTESGGRCIITSLHITVIRSVSCRKIHRLH